MIVGTSYSPGKAFITFAKDFIREVSLGHFGAAIAGLDVDDEGHRWSKQELLASIRNAGLESLSSPDGIAASAEPKLDEKVAGDVFELTHRLPQDGKWTEAQVTFRFERRKGDYFRVLLLSIEQAVQQAVPPADRPRMAVRG